MTLQVPFWGISWENIHFCGFLKKAYIVNGKKIKVNSTKKYIKFLSRGYFFPSYISPLVGCPDLPIRKILMRVVCLFTVMEE